MSKRILSEYDRQMLEVVELLTITKTDLTALRNIEFMPSGERRMLANIRRLVKMIRTKIGALPMPPPAEPDLVELSNAIYDTLLARQMGANTLISTADQLQNLGLTRSLSQYLAGLAELFPQPDQRQFGTTKRDRQNGDVDLVRDPLSGAYVKKDGSHL